ncbi:cation:proton antiporter [Brevundimonas sp. 2R-24]|uniref:Cation:proton antiporter n=1 Tax=Peiella sedimenti TaxID=3061083 RepID=A0ABT8SKW0_9CAUL|nr:cation:proton antiporter [Caulobacteraceae bacterium XZ-24]
MDGFQIGAAFLVLVAVVGWLNVRFLRLPTAVAMMTAGLLGAAALLLLSRPDSSVPAARELLDVLRGIDFSETVLGYMLAFLLFAGAMHVDMAELRRRGLSVLTLSTLGVLASTLIVGFSLWWAAGLLGLPLPLPWAFVFGALISPTDPIAVLAAARQGKPSELLKAVLQGEALFNDGVGIVVFGAALTFAVGAETHGPLITAGHALLEAGGGGAIGASLALIAIRALRSIDDYAAEVIITLALAAGAYALAQALHFSGPIAGAVAGLLVGTPHAATAMSQSTQRYVRGFWALVDEILNALLFLFLGLELAVLGIDGRHAGLWLAAIVLVLASRLLVVLPWGWGLRRRHAEAGLTRLLWWGGLRGAISLALALTLPQGPERDLVLSATFAVVAFSVLVQGLSFPALTRRLTDHS